MTDNATKQPAGGGIEEFQAAEARSDGAATIAEEILRRRAAEYARVPVEAELAGTAREVLVVAVGGERLGIPVSLIAELLKQAPVTPVPGGPPALVGFVNLRGDVLPVFDLCEVLALAKNGPTAPPSPRGGRTPLPWVAVIDDQADTFGLVVDAVEGVRAISSEEIESVAAEDTSNGLVIGVTSDSISLLDGEQLIRDTRLFVDQGEV